MAEEDFVGVGVRGGAVWKNCFDDAVLCATRREEREGKEANLYAPSRPGRVGLVSVFPY